MRQLFLLWQQLRRLLGLRTNWDYFSQRARWVLGVARTEAEMLNQPLVGSEHVLLGLLRDGEGDAGRALRAMGLDSSRVAAAVRRARRPEAPEKPLRLAQDTQRLLELALAAARHLGQEVDTVHLLWGLAQQEESRALDIMQTLGIAPAHVRAETAAMLAVADE